MRLSANDLNMSSDTEVITPSIYVGWRGRADEMLQRRSFDLSMGFVICCNILAMIYETDRNAACLKNNKDCTNDPVTPSINLSFLAIYTLEFAIRVFVHRLKVFWDASMHYEHVDAWNILDATVVFFGYVDVVMWFAGGDVPGPSLSMLRLMRVFRLLRAVRIFRKIPELKAMIRGFASAMKSMFWGFIMILVLLILFSVLSVELMQPVSIRVHQDDEYCRAAFEQVWFCLLMLFQTLVAGDSWGSCALPVVKDSWWAFFIFSGAVLCVQLGFMNLILAVIVENANRARLEDEEELANEKKMASEKLMKMLASIDTDGSGKISLQELMEGYENRKAMRLYFSQLGVSRSDLEKLFDLIYEDDDNEDELSYEIMMESLRDINTSDQRKNISFLRLQSEEMVRLMKRLCDRARPQFSPRPLYNEYNRNLISTAGMDNSPSGDSMSRVATDQLTSARPHVSTRSSAQSSYGSSLNQRSWTAGESLHRSKFFEPFEKEVAQLRQEIKGFADLLMKQWQDPAAARKVSGDSADEYIEQQIKNLKTSPQAVINFRKDESRCELLSSHPKLHDRDPKLVDM